MPPHKFYHNKECSCGKPKKPWCFSCDSCCQARLPYRVQELLNQASDLVEEETLGINPEKATWLQEVWVELLDTALLGAKYDLEQLDKQTGIERKYD